VRTDATSNADVLVVDDGNRTYGWLCHTDLLRIARSTRRAVDFHLGKPSGDDPGVGAILVLGPTRPHESLPDPWRGDLSTFGAGTFDK